jgi:TRAP-type mannitol/chloroaromatic compound transport system permease small subunit
MGFLIKMCRTIDKVSDWTAIGGSYLIFLLMLLVPFEVTMRYVFNSPTIWSGEIVQFILCALIAFGGANVSRVNGHVNVDVFYGRMRPKTHAWINLIHYQVAFFFLGLLIWKSWGVAVRSLSWGETSSSAFNPPIWPIKFFIPIGASLLLLQTLASYIRYILTLISGTSVDKGAQEVQK